MSIWLVAKCTLNEALLFCDEGLTGVGKFFIFKDIAVIVYGSLVPSIVEQSLFRALMSNIIFLTVLLDFVPK